MPMSQLSPPCQPARKMPIPGLLLLLFLAGCGRLDSIPTQPPQTPADWLISQPYTTTTIGGQTILLMQPTSTLFVYALGLVAIGIGLHAWRRWNGRRSWRWWGVALALWGMGALLAGTSYEGLSYHLKCAGWDVCRWTNWWEVTYLLLSAASINAMMLAQAYACANGRLRQGLIAYGLLNMGLYTTAVLIGAFVPVKFLVSFEFLILIAGPGIFGFALLNGWRYKRLRQRTDAVLLGTWLALGVVIGLYFLYYLLGITSRLWAQGIWFSENDILHLGLIAWMLYIGLTVLPQVQDLAGEAGHQDWE
ncbi:MAG: hypothetical protein KBE23_17050 [Chloroflexi bacterium]|nr:hypothetical protein [Chloroflexota bacterium]MBP7044462.1 hypothetical protein [Chloroflexota bacterium]